MESESEEEESDEEEEEEEGEGDEAAAPEGAQTPIVDAGLATPSGMSSVGMAAAAAGGETPELLELRKRRIEAEMEAGGETPNLYTVLPERGGQRVGASMMGSTHTYDLSQERSAPWRSPCTLSPRRPWSSTDATRSP